MPSCSPANFFSMHNKKKEKKNERQENKIKGQAHFQPYHFGGGGINPLSDDQHGHNSSCITRSPQHVLLLLSFFSSNTENSLLHWKWEPLPWARDPPISCLPEFEPSPAIANQSHRDRDSVRCMVIHSPGMALWKWVLSCFTLSSSLFLSPLPGFTPSAYPSLAFISLSIFLVNDYRVYQSLSLPDKSSSRTLTCSSCMRLVCLATHSQRRFNLSLLPTFLSFLLNSSAQDTHLSLLIVC